MRQLAPSQADRPHLQSSFHPTGGIRAETARGRAGLWPLQGSEGLEHPPLASLPGAPSVFSSARRCHTSCPGPEGPATLLYLVLLQCYLQSPPAPRRSQECDWEPAKRSVASASGF